MILSTELGHYDSVFLDTAPVIYYIEANPQFGPLARDVVSAFQSGSVSAFSSVITLTEVLAKPLAKGDEKLARRFAEFLKNGKNFFMTEISENIAETAGELRGRYPFLRTVDALQISAAITVGSDVFVTNDAKLKQVVEIKVLVLKDYL